MMFIAVLALVLFGPKKLPEIGRTVGKAISEFKRASTELKSTFEREMQTLEQETESIKTITSQYQYDAYNYDYSSEAPYEGSYGTENHESAGTPSTLSASATEGAESPTAVTPEGVIARGAETASVNQPNGTSPEADTPAEFHDAITPNLSAFEPVLSDGHSTLAPTTPEHNA
jgi:sec-independent protein translocase protein TatA